MLCLDYQQVGAQSAEQCGRGYSYVPVKSGAGGICVGTCRKGDTQVIRELRGLLFMGLRHDIDLPVCQIDTLNERGVKTRGTRAIGLGGIFSIVIWVFIISWAIKLLRGSLQPAQAQYPSPYAYGYGV
jgi:hypothetical protein